MEKRKGHLERYCPRLGGAITFMYCMTCGDDRSACWKVIDCWWEYFDIMAYLKENLSEDAMARLLSSKPKPKIESILDLITQAKTRTE